MSGSFGAERPAALRYARCDRLHPWPIGSISRCRRSGAFRSASRRWFGHSRAFARSPFVKARPHYSALPRRAGVRHSRIIRRKLCRRGFPGSSRAKARPYQARLQTVDFRIYPHQLAFHLAVLGIASECGFQHSLCVRELLRLFQQSYVVAHRRDRARGGLVPALDASLAPLIAAQPGCATQRLPRRDGLD
jgi:hypothetical protein